MPRTDEVDGGTAERREALEARDALERASATRGRRTEQHEQEARNYKAREAWQRREEQLADEFKAQQAAVQRAGQAEGGASSRAGEIEAELRTLPRIGREALDRMVAGAAEAFYVTCERSGWIGGLVKGNIGTPPPELIAYHVLAAAEDGQSFAERVHRVIDQMTASTSHNAPTDADEDTLRADLKTARADREQAGAAKAKATAALEEAGQALKAHELGHAA